MPLVADVPAPARGSVGGPAVTGRSTRPWPSSSKSLSVMFSAAICSRRCLFIQYAMARRRHPRRLPMRMRRWCAERLVNAGAGQGDVVIILFVTATIALRGSTGRYKMFPQAGRSRRRRRCPPAHGSLLMVALFCAIVAESGKH